MTREGKYLKKKKKEEKKHKGKDRGYQALPAKLRFRTNKSWSVVKTSAKVLALPVASPSLILLMSGLLYKKELSFLFICQA